MNKVKKIFAYFSLFQIWSLILIPFVLLILPSTYFDNGQTVCISIWLFNTECWGCGITRATMHLLHLEYKDAIFFNILSFVVLPLLSIIWFGISYRYFKHVFKEKTLMVSFLYKWKLDASKSKKSQKSA